MILLGAEIEVRHARESWNWDSCNNLCWEIVNVKIKIWLEKWLHINRLWLGGNYVYRWRLNSYFVRWIRVGRKTDIRIYIIRLINSNLPGLTGIFKQKSVERDVTRILVTPEWFWADELVVEHGQPVNCCLRLRVRSYSRGGYG